MSNFGEFKTTNDRGALSPIYQALQLNFSNDFIGKIIITEGITDYYFFTLIKKHSNLIPKNLKIIPSSGASQSSTLISLAIPFSDNFSVFLDNDKAGHSAAKKYMKEFGEKLITNLHIYNKTESKFLLEDFFM